MTLVTSFGGDAIVRASRNHAVISVREEGDRARSYLHVFTPLFFNFQLSRQKIASHKLVEFPINNASSTRKNIFAVPFVKM